MRLPNWNLTFSAKRRLQRIGLISLIVAMVLFLIWFCWVVWLERYVVYTREGATINMELQDPITQGQLAAPPSADEAVDVYINEGSDTINTSTELAQIVGYYIDTDTLTGDLPTAMDVITTLPPDTAVMVELKNIWGTFFYSSQLEDASLSTKLDTTKVDALIQEITSRNLYAIAYIPAFRERNYCLNHSLVGLEVTKRTHLWLDDESCYWLDPTDKGALNWVISIVEELKALGFEEVVFSEFRMPSTNSIYFKGDRDEAIASAAATIVSTCATERFAVSFIVTDNSFPMPEGGRCRLYMEDVGAKDVANVVVKMTVPDTVANLVFLATTNDTRYQDFSHLRPILTAVTDKQ